MMSDRNYPAGPQARVYFRDWTWGTLIVQLLAFGIGLAATGKFEAVATNDTPSYEMMSWNSWGEVLGAMRTPGYPVFLSTLRATSSHPTWIPVGHFVAYSLGVMFFFSGLRRLTQDHVRALIAASALLYSRILLGYCHFIATDTLAAAVGLLVCGLTMHRLVSPGALMSVLLSLAVTAGWLIRPAYLFLVPLVPVLTWILYPSIHWPPRNSRWRHLLITTLLVVSPLLLYSSLRLAVVGKFGIVSFGGYNLLGVAGQFLEPRDVPLLSADLRDLATSAIERRDSGHLPHGLHDDLPLMNYMRLEDRYDITIWHVFSTSDPSTSHQNAVEPNALRRRLAQELIRLHPKEYAIWLFKANRQAARKLLWDFADSLLGFLLLVLAILVLGLRGIRGSDWRPEGIQSSDSLKVLIQLAVIYCLMCLAVVIPVCPPLGRFTDAASVFLASPVAVWIWDAIQSLRSGASRTLKTSCDHDSQIL